MSRDAILDSAAQVIRLKGYHGASMADIAEAVQLQKASLYHYFSSKQEILLELLDTALDFIIEQMAFVMQQNIPYEEKLRLAVHTYLNALNKHGDLVSVLLLEHRSLDPEFHGKHIPKRDQFENMWRVLLSEGVAANEFKIADIPLTVRGLLGVMNWTITWYRSDGDLSIDEIADQFTDLFLFGFKQK